MDGRFVCTDWDFPCPPGTSRRQGSPQNWCFADPAVATGADVPWYATLPTLGREIGEWGATQLGKIPGQAEPIGRGIRGALPKMPSVSDILPKLPEFHFPEIHLPEAQVHLTSDMPTYEKPAHELSEGLKKAAVIVAVGALAYGIIRGIAAASGEG